MSKKDEKIAELERTLADLRSFPPLRKDVRVILTAVAQDKVNGVDRHAAMGILAFYGINYKTPQWQRGDFVEITLGDKDCRYKQHLVASDNLSTYTPDQAVWTVCADENDWTSVGLLLSTQHVNDHNPVLLHRIAKS